MEDQTEIICRQSPKGTIHFVNPAFCSFFGVCSDEILGTDLYRLSNPIHRVGMIRERTEPSKANIPVEGDSGEVITAEEAVEVPGKGVRWLQWTERPIFDPSGEITEYQRVGRDITEKKQVIEELRITKHAIDSSINAIGIADLSGNVTYVNRAYLDMWGYRDEKDALGLPIWAFAHSNHYARGVIEEVMEALSQSGGWIGEAHAFRRDGSPFDVQVSATMVRDATGQPLAQMASFVDISSRRKAEEDLYLKECAIEASITGIGIFDLAGRLIFANKTFLQLFELASPPGPGGLPFECLYERDPAAIPFFLRLRVEVIEKGHWFGEVLKNRKDGSAVTLQVSATLSRDRQGSPLSLMMGVVDITAQKSIELAYRTIYEKLQDTMEFIPDPTFIVDRDHRVIAWNRAMESLTGFSKGEVLGKTEISGFFPFLSGIRPLLADLVGLSVDQVARRYPMVRHFGDTLFVESYIPSLNEGRGGYLWGKASLLTDESGNIGVIESFRDVTHWKRAEESIRAGLRDSIVYPLVQDDISQGDTDTMGYSPAFPGLEGERPANLTSLEGDPAVFLDITGKVMLANSIFLKMMERTQKGVIMGRSIASFIAEEYRRAFLDSLDETRTWGSAEREIVLLAPDGRIPVLATISALFNKRHQVIGFSGLFRVMRSSPAEAGNAKKNLPRHDLPDTVIQGTTPPVTTVPDSNLHGTIL